MRAFGYLYSDEETRAQREEAERKAREEKLIFGEGERGEEKNY